MRMIISNFAPTTSQRPSYAGGQKLPKQTTLPQEYVVVCISDTTTLYGVSERIKELQIGKTYTVTDIWEQNTYPNQFYYINDEYYPCDMFKLLNEVREEKLNKILK